MIFERKRNDQMLTKTIVQELIAREIEKLTERPPLLRNVKSNCLDDYWLTLKDLCDYLPNKPAKRTIYNWTCQHSIPFHKKKGRLRFLKSEIDKWLQEDNLVIPDKVEPNKKEE